MMFYIIIAIVLLLTVYILVTYNSLIKLNNIVKEVIINIYSNIKSKNNILYLI